MSIVPQRSASAGLAGSSISWDVASVGATQNGEELESPEGHRRGEHV
jgi:hypothetical protein